MIVKSWDTETELILPGLVVPQMVCLTTAERIDGEVRTQIFLKEDGLDWIEAQLDDDNVIIVGHNHPYDLAVVCHARPRLLYKVFAKLDKGLARDTLTQQQMLDIATGEMKFYCDEDGEPKRTSYSLSALSYRILKKFLKKEDTWRLRYGELITVPLDLWPEDAKKYAIDDAVTTLEVSEEQEKQAGIPREVSEIPNAKEQFKAAWALHLMSAWGVRTDGDAVAQLKAELEKDLEENMLKLRKTPLIKQVKKKGVYEDVKDMKSIRARVEAAFGALGQNVPRTDPSKKFPDGQVATDKKTMLDSKDPELKLLSETGALEKLLSTYIPALEGGTKFPINAFFNALVETGRTSCIAEGTPIEIVRDVSQYPDGVPVEQVKAGDLAYAFDQDRNLVLRRVRWAGKTGTKSVVRLRWQGQGHQHQGYVDLTEDHKVRLVTGAYRAARDLLPGDRVMALSRGLSAGYARMWATGHDEITREHRFIYEQVYGKTAEHIHHLNHNKLDNRVENLQGLSHSEHTAFHSQHPSDELRQKRSALGKRRWAEGNGIPTTYGPEKWNWLGLTKEWIIEQLWRFKGRPVFLCRAHGIDYATLQKYLALHGVDFRVIRKNFNDRGELIDEALLKRAADAGRNGGGVDKAQRVAGLGYYTFKTAQEQHGLVPYNHEVLSVEPLPGKVAVYDLEIEDVHNFIAGEICVHNCRSPNWQNPPRKGKVRECIVPRKGRVFISADFSTIELRALAQVQLDLFGRSRMAEVLRKGDDLHLTLAAQLLGITTTEVVALAKEGDAEAEDARQLAKIGNFGFPGGLSPPTFVDYAAGYGTVVTLDRAREAHAAFFATWTEMREYFDHIENLADEGSMVQMRSGRLRGGISYRSAANGYFQGLAADGCKAALWEVTKECYLDTNSPLYGSRPIIFMHDEIIAETSWDANAPERASAAAFRLAEVMRLAMEKWIPDVPIAAEPVMCRRWYKGAKPAMLNGIMVPSKPQVVEKDGKKRTIWVPDC